MSDDIIRQKRVISIDVFEQTIVATVYGNRKETLRRIVTAADVVHLFAVGGQAANWLTFSDRVLRIGFSPDGSLRALVRRPPSRTRVKFRIGKRNYVLRMRIPALLAIVGTEAGQWKTVESVLAYQGSLTARTPLYAAPFPNCYADGSVCMGSVTVTDGLTPEAAFEQLFIASGFTDHAMQEPLADKKRWRTIWQALKETNGNVPLNALKKVTTYGKWLKA